MNPPALLHNWAPGVEFAAVGAVVILGLCLSIGAVPLGDALRRLAAILLLAVFFIQFPGIVLADWSAMTFWQRCGVIVFGVVLALAAGKLRSGTKRH